MREATEKSSVTESDFVTFLYNYLHSDCIFL